MTSFLIESFVDRASHLPHDEECTFCAIARGATPAHIVHADEHVLAFLDILPIRRGHLLVVPRGHYPRITDIPAEAAARLGAALPGLARALAAALNNRDMNIVSNQGHAQVVPHLHFHLVPAPVPGESSRSGWLARNELDDAQAARLVADIKRALAQSRL